jgi:hypothetical protein
MSAFMFPASPQEAARLWTPTLNGRSDCANERNSEQCRVRGEAVSALMFRKREPKTKFFDIHTRRAHQQ